MLKKSSDDAFHFDVLAEILDPRDQATNTADHQIDLDPRAGGLIEPLDHSGIFERIELRPNFAVLVLFLIRDLPLNEVKEIFPQIVRRRDDPLPRGGHRIAGDDIEHIGDVLGDIFVVGEIADIRVHFGRVLIVISRR